MFGIGLPEMIVILAVALIVVGPDKLPDLARSLAKGVVELKRTVNQVKASFDEENDMLNEVHGELKKSAGDFRRGLIDNEPGNRQAGVEATGKAELDEETIDVQSLEERPWERDRKKEPEIVDDPDSPSVARSDQQIENDQEINGSPPPPSA